MSRTTGQAFAPSYVDLKRVMAVQFGLMDADEIRKMSVADIKNERIYNEDGIPNFHGIMDPRMGTMQKDMKCVMCKGSNININDMCIA